MRVAFYNVFMEEEIVEENKSHNKLTDISLLGLLDHISTLDSENRTVKLSDDCFYSLPQFRDLGNNRRAFWIGKFLKDKPYNGKIGTDDVKEIVGEAYQPVVGIFDATNRMLVVETTMVGPKKAKIEEFFNSYICEEEGNGNTKYELKMIRQKSNTTINEIDDRTEILGVYLQIRVDEYNSDNFQRNRDGQNMLVALTDRNVAFGKEYKANVISIALQKGRYKNDLKNTIIDVVRTINAEDTSLISAKVDVKFPSGKKDTIDLKGNKFMSFSKNTGDVTGFDALTTILNESYEDNEFPTDCYHYLVDHFAGEYIECPNEHVNYKAIPYGGYKENEEQSPEHN